MGFRRLAQIFGASEGPRGHAIMAITNRCNQRCTFCLQSEVMSMRDEPSLEAIGQQMRDLYARGARAITFMSGESTLRQDLPEVLALAKSIGFRVLCTATNGTTLGRPGYAARLRDAGLDTLEFSIHGMTAEQNTAITRHRHGHQLQMAALEAIERAGIPVIFNVVLCHENLATAVGFPGFLRARFPRLEAVVRWKFLNRIGRGAVLDRALRYDDVDVDALAASTTAADMGVYFDTFPLCRLGAARHLSMELISRVCSTTYFDVGSDSNDYHATGYQLGGHGLPEEPCDHCAARVVCPGVEVRYFREEGTAELRAISESAEEIAARTRAAIGLEALAPERLVGQLGAPLPRIAPEPSVLVNDAPTDDSRGREDGEVPPEAFEQLSEKLRQLTKGSWHVLGAVRHDGNLEIHIATNAGEITLDVAPSDTGREHFVNLGEVVISYRGAPAPRTLAALRLLAPRLRVPLEQLATRGDVT